MNFVPVVVTAANLKTAIQQNTDLALAALATKMFAFEQRAVIKAALDAGGFRIRLVECDPTDESNALTREAAQDILSEL